jgi:hypothetical protein
MHGRFGIRRVPEDEQIDDAWFDLDVVELADHATGTDIRIGETHLLQTPRGFKQVRAVDNSPRAVGVRGALRRMAGNSV